MAWLMQRHQMDVLMNNSLIAHLNMNTGEIA